jgi:subtilisin family serine protease
MNLKRHIALAILTAAVILPAYAFGSPDGQRRYRPGELLVRYRTTTQPAYRAALERSARVRASATIGRSRIARVILDADTTVAQAQALYEADPNVEFVEPNYLLHAQTLPDDTDFSRQWALYNTGQVVSGYVGTAGADMDAPSAWNISTGRSDVVVAVVDTGCDLNHPDLAANIWSNPGEIPGNGIDDDGNGYIDDIHGWDFVDTDNLPQDATGHGSHMAGIIAAVGDNGRGIAGVAWQVRIMPLRFMNAFNEGTIADAIDAIEYALDKGVKIINCSWGSSGYSLSLQHVMAEADALFVCAAGNDGSDTDLDPFYPASFSGDRILSVAASDQMDQLAWFSNYGTASVDVAAPGVRIYSLDDGRQTLWQETFDQGWPDGWQTGGSGDDWAVCDPPATANAPALALSPQGSYVNQADTWAQAPVQNLASAAATQLTFRLIGRSQTHSDYLNLEVSTDGTAWHALQLLMGGNVYANGISGSIPYWMTATADLGPWDGQSQLYVRLHFQSDATGTDTGFYVDNLQLTAAGAADNYQFMQGTSMAAGYVSGLAALILSENSTLTPRELKSIIDESVDLSQNLLQQVASGGRVNAHNALTLLRELSLTAAPAAADRIRLTWTTQAPLDSLVVIERRTESQNDFHTIAQVDAATTAYADNDLAANATYYYRVYAQTRDGRSGYSNQSLATTQEPAAATSAAAGGGGGGGCFIAALGRN